MCNKKMKNHEIVTSSDIGTLKCYFYANVDAIDKLDFM